MRLGTSGIGWLIFGVLVCASSTEAYGIPAKLSTIALGLVFVATYLIKNWFDPKYKALFIIGGTFIAFSIENGRDEATMIALCIAAVSLFIFYLVNKEVINAWLGGASITEYPYDEDYEEYEEEEIEAETGGPSEMPAEDAEIEVETETETENNINQVESEDVVEFSFDRTEN